MLRTFGLVLSLFGCSLVFAGPLRAQATSSQLLPAADPGLHPYSAYGGVRENIDLATGNLNLQIPLLHLPGRNRHDLDIVLQYDSKNWILNHIYISELNKHFYTWQQDSHWPGINPPFFAWRLNVPTILATFTQVDAANSIWCTANFLVTLADGSKHWFPNRTACKFVSPTPQYDVAIGDSDDGTYMRLDTSNPQDVILYTKNGTRTHFTLGIASSPSANANKIVDSDGNLITIQSTTAPSRVNSITDSLNRAVTLTWNADGTLGSISYKDSAGATQAISLSHSSVQIAPTFTLPTGSGSGSSTVLLLSTVTMPNGLSYAFQYNNFGEITKVTYPSGGYTRYDHAAFTALWRYRPAPNDGSTAADFREVTARRVCTLASGACTSATEEVTTYTPTANGTQANNQYMDVRTPDLNRVRHEFTFGDAVNQVPREINQFVYQGESTLVRTIGTSYTNGSSAWTLPATVKTTLSDTNQVSQIQFTYDTYTAIVSVTRDPSGGFPASTTRSINNDVLTTEYDFGNGTPGPALRKTVRTWLKGAYSSTSPHILDRKASEQVQNSTGTIIAQFQFEYDNFTEGLTASGSVQHDSSFSTSYTTRGKITATKRWRNTDGVWLTTRNQDDDAGNLRKTADPGTHITLFAYNDSWGNQTCIPTGGGARAYLTSVTDALSHVSSKTYNSCTGSVASATDQNSKITTFGYDLMNRLIQTSFPDGGQSSVTYNEAATPLNVATTTKITPSLSLTSQVYVDGLGRVTQAQLTSDPDGITKTDTTYDGLDRPNTVSNPYRTATDPGPTNGTTTTQYDGLGRVTKVIPPDGTTSANNISTIYSGNCTTVTDQAGKKRKSCSDALGRLIQVFEPDSGGNFIYETDYQYDTLDNLTRVDQKGNDANSANWRTRTSTYNSLSQLLTATNPESGTITYTYDNDGNLLTKTAPAPNQSGTATVTTTYAYDALNRHTQKSFSDTTPVVKYGYDAVAPAGCTPPTLTIANGIGRRTSMCDAAGSEAWSYDAMGRPLTDRRTTNSTPSNVTKDTIYTYNLDGSVATLTYPSTRVITYTPGGSGRPLEAKDITSSINYATNAHYAPQGALTYAQNGANLYSTFLFNNRLQPCWMYSTTGTALPWQSTNCPNTASTATILDFKYDFGLGVADNGNVASIANNRDTTRSQSFTYDSLNRILTAKTSSTTGTKCWDESMGYDPWGNLLSIGRISGYTCSNEELLGVTATTKNQISGDTYDAAGNLTTIPSVGSYTYDAENRLLTAGGVTYSYDGDGKRVKKSNGKLYWYGMDSDPLDETDLAGNTNNSSFNEYIFFNGERIARRDFNNTVNYYFADHLGTSREIVQAGQTTACYDADFYPFGGERKYTDTCPQNYKFTSKERDSESGLDDFGARYFASTMGRFSSPDEPFVDQQSGDPQSWNLYSYVRNNPLNNADPTGNACVQGTDGKYSNDDSSGQSCEDAAQPDKVEVKAQAPPSADNQRIVDFANEMNKRPVLKFVLAVAGGGAIIGATGGAACYYLCPAATVTTIGVTAARVAPLLPVVAGAIEKLQKLGISVQEASEIVASPESQKLVDNLHNGNIDVIKEVGGQLVRITTNPEGTRIISAGLMRANQIANGIANGRFVPK